MSPPRPSGARIADRRSVGTCRQDGPHGRRPRSLLRAPREWFDGAFPAPTAAQLGAWDSIASGSHTLVVAPTGSGKTLSAFLWALDRLATAVEAGASDEKRAAERRTTEQRTTKVLYISPLKALGVDVERNLRAPLVGITQTAKRLGFEPPEIRVGVRSGDTPTGERRKMIKTPPDILITTPESLFLMLTSSARETLTGVETVIVDEVHAVAGTKRGAHLALSLERLDMLRDKPVQRIGLSATVRPHEEVGRFLAGSAPIRIVAPPAAKTFDLTVRVPVEDMTELGIAEPDPESMSPTPQAGSIWPHVEEQIVDLILDHRSSIVFANSRRLAEKLTARSTRSTPNGSAAPSRSRADRPRSSARPPRSTTVPIPCWRGPTTARSARTSGRSSRTTSSPGVCAAWWPPAAWNSESTWRSRSRGAGGGAAVGRERLQRVGRAGHQVGEISRGVLFPKHRTDLIHCAVTVERMTNGKIEALEIPANPLDILAQQTVAATALEPLDVEQWYDVVRRSGSFATLPRSAYESTLDLLAGRYPSDEFAELRPRLVWDRDGGTLTGRPGSQRLAVTSGGAIPTAACSPSTWWASDSPGSANSTRRWSTSPAWATCSRSAPPVGGSRRSPTTGCWSVPRTGCPDGCRSGTATVSAVPPNSARPSAASCASCRPARRTRWPRVWSPPGSTRTPPPTSPR